MGNNTRSRAARTGKVPSAVRRRRKGAAPRQKPKKLVLDAKWAEISAKLAHNGRPIPVNDLWIAAIALSRPAVLVTNDRHFSHVDGLEPENWTQ